VGAQLEHGEGIIGAIDGAIGLVLPAATWNLFWLTPAAAAALVALMVLAVTFRAHRPRETAASPATSCSA